MALIVAGVNHRGASVAVRERIALRPAEIAPMLQDLAESAGANEAVILSTCNRTEVYLVDEAEASVPRVWESLSQRSGDDASSYGYVRRDRDAVAHLYRVASGLDSMVLGEAQIHGQVRDAWERSRTHSGARLNRLFQSALQVAGRVRNETEVGRGAASVSSAAVQLARQIFGSLAGRRAMVLGAGEMAELALECLGEQGVTTSIVANRTYDRAVQLAERYGATAMRYEECWTALADVDVLMCSTAAPRPVVTVEHVRETAASRGDRPLCILDIALPRDVEPAVGEIDNVYLYNLDDLQAVVAANLERRRAELPTAEQLIAGEVERYWEWLAGLAAVPVLTQFRGHMDEMRREEVAAALKRLDRLSPEEREVVEQLSRSLMNKFLHGPTVRLRSGAANGRGLGIVDAVRYLFGLDRSPHPAADAPRTFDDE